jgi:hypothetical protein
MTKIIRHDRKSLGTGELPLCGGGVSRGRILVLRSEYATNRKAEHFSWGQTGCRFALKCAVFPPYRLRLHIAVIGNFIFIAIRTVPPPELST